MKSQQGDKPKVIPKLDRLPVNARLKRERLEGRFSQKEFADKMQIPRAALANYETGRAKIPFGIGLRICRRLDLNPRWLATGAEPKRPFVELEKLRIPHGPILESAMARRLDFGAGYDAFLKSPMEAWVSKTPHSKLIMEQMKGGPERLAPRLSDLDLVTQIEEFAATMKAEPDVQMREGYFKTVAVLTRELRSRLEAKFYRLPPK